MRNRILISFYCLFILTVISFGQIPSQTNSIEPDVTLSLDQKKIEVDVSESYFVVTFAGKVKCESQDSWQNVRSIEVQLFVECNWDSTVDPVTVVLTPEGNESESFNVFIKVPRWSTVYEDGNVVISGMASPKPGALGYAVEPVNGTIIVKPHTNLMLMWGKDINGNLGDDLDAPLRIINTGNYDENVSLSFASNGSDLSDWSLTFSRNKFNMIIGEDIYEGINLKIPPLTKLGTYELVIRVTAGGMGGDENSVIRYCNFNIEIESGGTGTGDGPEEDGSTIDGNGTEEGEGLFGYFKWYWFVLIIFIIVLISGIVIIKKHVRSKT